MLRFTVHWCVFDWLMQRIVCVFEKEKLVPTTSCVLSQVHTHIHTHTHTHSQQQEIKRVAFSFRLSDGQTFNECEPDIRRDAS